MKDRMVFIFSAIECVERCTDYTKGMTVGEFKTDLKTQDAVIRNIEVLGQSLKDFGIENLAMDYPEIRWNALAGMRNIIAHEYLGIDLDIVWETLVNHLIPLGETLLQIKNKNIKRT